MDDAPCESEDLIQHLLRHNTIHVKTPLQYVIGKFHLNTALSNCVCRTRKLSIALISITFHSYLQILKIEVVDVYS